MIPPPPRKAFSITAARSVQTPFPDAVSHTPSPGSASTTSAVLFTVKGESAAATLAASGLDGGSMTESGRDDPTQSKANKLLRTILRMTYSRRRVFLGGQVTWNPVIEE